MSNKETPLQNPWAENRKDAKRVNLSHTVNLPANNVVSPRISCPDKRKSHIVLSIFWATAAGIQKDKTLGLPPKECQVKATEQFDNPLK